MSLLRFLQFMLCLQNGDTPLHIACRFGYLECVMKFIEHNVTTDVVNENLDTPLLVAISEKHENVAMYLLYNAPGNLEVFNSVSKLCSGTTSMLWPRINIFT